MLKKNVCLTGSPWSRNGVMLALTERFCGNSSALFSEMFEEGQDRIIEAARFRRFAIRARIDYDETTTRTKQIKGAGL